jgi:hypothetical protein
MVIQTLIVIIIIITKMKLTLITYFSGRALACGGAW